jgi:PAS domain S-box-containing protein
VTGTKILVVEDEYIISQDLMVRLENMGYAPLGPAATGDEAIELVSNEQPDVVLMDIALSGEMDGIDTAEQIKTDYNIPVIYVTAFSDDSVVDRAKPTEPYGYLIKPFVDKELKATIETAFYKHQMEDQLRRSREQYRALLNASGAVPWEMDALTKRFTYVGSQSKSVLGISPQDMDSLEKWLGMVHPDDITELRELYAWGPEHQEGREVEYRVTLGGNRQLWIRDMLSSSGESDGPEMIRGYMQDITIRKQAELERQRYTEEIKEALDRIQTLQGLLPICAWCKKIRDDQGYWQQVEVYVKDHSKAEFTHSICPDCKKQVEEEMDD